ncbi:hypothetical protein CANCADRAFT_14145, partial [Tortispora caseinolytica NRRL Y-17796]
LEDLHNEPFPSVRTYLEWLCSRITSRHEDFLDTIWEELSIPENIPKYTGSVQMIMLLSILSFTEDLQKKLIPKFYAAVLPFAASNRAGVRHFTISLMPALLPQAKRLGISEDPSLNGLTNLDKHIRAAPQYKQFRSGEALLWDVYDDYTLCGIAGGVLCAVSDPVSGFTSAACFHQLEDIIPGGLQIEIGTEMKNKWTLGIPDESLKDNHDTTVVSQPLMDASITLQTKSGNWNTVFEAEGDSREASTKRGHLIIVASLVENIHNLGGICRLCDVLGAELMTVPNMQVVKHHDFRNVAVTADLWMPMEEVAPESIIPFLSAKSKQGYTIIGLEQTDDSIELTKDTAFPEKSVLVLGKEREGIPARILAEVDFCIEIKQVGVVRSMNIQTATAVVAHAYSMSY